MVANMDTKEMSPSFSHDTANSTHSSPKSNLEAIPIVEEVEDPSTEAPVCQNDLLLEASTIH